MGITLEKCEEPALSLNESLVELQARVISMRDKHNAFLEFIAGQVRECKQVSACWSDYGSCPTVYSSAASVVALSVELFRGFHL